MNKSNLWECNKSLYWETESYVIYLLFDAWFQAGFLFIIIKFKNKKINKNKISISNKYKLQPKKNQNNNSRN